MSPLSVVMDTTLQQWRLEMQADGYSPRTVRGREAVVKIISRAAGVTPSALTREHVLAYLTTRELAVRTRRSYLSHLKAFSDWRGTNDLTEGIRRPPVPRAVPRPVTEVQLRRLLLAARPDHRERTFLVLGAYAGLRAFETAKVAVEHLEDLGAGYALRVVGKGGTDALVPVSEIVVEEMRVAGARVGGRGRLFPRASPDSVRNDLRRLGGRAGVSFSSHQLRHRYGTAVYAVDRDLLLTQQVMRHASPATTAGYALLVATRAAEVVNQLPGAVRGSQLTLGGL